MLLQSVIRTIYPLACIGCDSPVQSAHGLCPDCWSQTTFVKGLCCNTCGAPLPGSEDAGEVVQCDDCLTTARPWESGRTVLSYDGIGRRLVLAFKHGDRTDLAPTFAKWIAAAAKDLCGSQTVIVPVPLHWTRLLRRRYNQAALLAQATARATGSAVCVDALLRPKRTAPLDGHSADQRFAALDAAIVGNPKRADKLGGRSVLLVDDVMTSGATLAAGTEALYSLGAGNVSIVTLARVLKAP